MHVAATIGDQQDIYGIADDLINYPVGFKEYLAVIAYAQRQQFIKQVNGSRWGVISPPICVLGSSKGGGIGGIGVLGAFGGFGVKRLELLEVVEVLGCPGGFA